jgi:hypothetical protein
MSASGRVRAADALRAWIVRGGASGFDSCLRPCHLPIPARNRGSMYGAVVQTQGFCSRSCRASPVWEGQAQLTAPVAAACLWRSPGIERYLVAPGAIPGGSRWENCSPGAALSHPCLPKRRMGRFESHLRNGDEHRPCRLRRQVRSEPPPVEPGDTCEASKRLASAPAVAGAARAINAGWMVLRPAQLMGGLGLGHAVMLSPERARRASTLATTPIAAGVRDCPGRARLSPYEDGLCARRCDSAACPHLTS